jgi:hypothetical protein
MPPNTTFRVVATKAGVKRNQERRTKRAESGRQEKKETP